MHRRHFFRIQTQTGDRGCNALRRSHEVTKETTSKTLAGNRELMNRVEQAHSSAETAKFKAGMLDLSADFEAWLDWGQPVLVYL